MTVRDITSVALDSEEEVAEGRKVVAVVGIDRYRAWPTLDNAVSDARGALAVFQQVGFETLAAPLINEMATADAIRRLVTDDLATLGSDDSLVLFFAGHGHTQTRMLPSGPLQTGYLIPVDGDRPAGQTATWLRLDTWLSDVARIPARHILVILDACHSGIALGSLIKWRGGSSARPGGSLEELRRRQSRRVITSALGDQLAMDGGPIDGRSLFTGCLIEGLTGGLAREGRLEATGSEIGVYVQQRVTSYTGSRQTPDFGTLELDQRGELVVPIAVDARPRQRVTSSASTRKTFDLDTLELKIRDEPVVPVATGAQPPQPSTVPSAPMAMPAVPAPADVKLQWAYRRSNTLIRQKRLGWATLSIGIVGSAVAITVVLASRRQIGSPLVNALITMSELNPWRRHPELPNGPLVLSQDVTIRQYVMVALAGRLSKPAGSSYHPLNPEMENDEQLDRPILTQDYMQAEQFCRALEGRLLTIGEWHLASVPGNYVKKVDGGVGPFREWTLAENGVSKSCGKSWSDVKDDEENYEICISAERAPLVAAIRCAKDL